MADKFDALVPKILPLVRMFGSDSESEATNALRALVRLLYGAGLDIHALAERIEKPPPKPLNKAEIDAIFEAGRSKGRTEEVELRQRAVSAITSRPLDDISNGYGGYAWREIAGHCLDNLHRIPSSHHGFIESVADRLAGGRELTKPQAEYLRNLFRRHFNGTIT